MNSDIWINTESFERDIRAIFTKEILDITKKFNIQTKLNDEEFLNKLDGRNFFHDYFIFKIKFPDLKPRKVIITEECKNSELFKNNIQHIDEIKNIFEKGENFYPYLSKGLLNHEKYNNGVNNNADIKIDYDVMLFTTRIHHLHLNDIKESDGFIKRSSNLLFCVILENFVYFLNIDNHGNWCKKFENELFDIIKNNIETNKDLKQAYNLFFKLSNHFSIVKEFSGKEKYSLSKNNIMTSFSSNSGEAFAPYFYEVENFGYTNSDNLYQLIEKLKQFLESNKKKICSISRRNNRNNKFYNIFNLQIIEDKNWLIIEDKFHKSNGIFSAFQLKYGEQRQLVDFLYRK